MKTIDIKNIKGIDFNGGTSYRSVLKKDGMGFALMRTHVKKGGPYLWHYKNHLEVCYCISGNAIIEDLETGEVSKIYPGITYFVDKHQPHNFTALEDTVLISVFNPPLRGDETHDKDGNYN